MCKQSWPVICANAANRMSEHVLRSVLISFPLDVMSCRTMALVFLGNILHCFPSFVCSSSVYLCIHFSVNVKIASASQHLTSRT